MISILYQTHVSYLFSCLEIMLVPIIYSINPFAKNTHRILKSNVFSVKKWNAGTTYSKFVVTFSRILAFELHFWWVLANPHMIVVGQNSPEIKSDYLDFWKRDDKFHLDVSLFPWFLSNLAYTVIWGSLNTLTHS